MKLLVRNTLLGASISLVSLGGLAGAASANPGAGTPLDPILCTVTSPDPSSCSAAPDEGESEEGEPSEGSQSPYSQPAAPGEEDPLCGLTAGLVCAPNTGDGETPEEGGETGEDPSSGSGEDPAAGEASGDEFEEGEGTSSDDVEKSDPPEYGPGSEPGGS